MIRVYLAGAITKPDPMSNALIAIGYADELMMYGFAPYVPQLSVFQQKYGRFDALNPEDYEKFMQLDFEWLSQCDVLFRIEGYSPGADREVEYALKHDIPVFYDFGVLLRYGETIKEKENDKRKPKDRIY
jgi:nucleoside 2-deoxyribosyltransferase